MPNHGFTKPPQWEQASTSDAATINDVSTSKSDLIGRSAAALAQVRRDVITGEGPTVAGRVHFSRTIDSEDTALCRRIVIVAGQNGDPVSRAEADALFEIYAVASERTDGGRFDDLLAKAVVHHVMSACGHDVPRREVALAPAMALNAWASLISITAEVRAFSARLESRRIPKGSAMSESAA
jgi:hypothetical protein